MKTIFICSKKYGSNFIIEARTVLFEPRGAWKIIAGLGLSAKPDQPSALRAGPFFCGELSPDVLRCLLDKVRNYFAHNPNDFN